MRVPAAQILFAYGSEMLKEALANKPDRRDVLAWIAEAHPVILVLYDGAQDCAYWLSIQRHFADQHAFARLRGKTVTLAIPTANRMSEQAVREFARDKAAILAPEGD